MNLFHLLARSARVTPEAPALHLGTQLVARYGQLARRSVAVSAWLRRAGLVAGDRVALAMSNRPQFLEVVFGAWHAGAAVVPINAKLHPLEMRYILEDSAAAALFVSRDVGDPLSAHLAGLPAGARVVDVDSPHWHTGFAGSDDGAEPASRAPEDLAWLFYTSGTTGRPKGVMLTHRNLLAMTLAYFADVEPVRPGDATLYAAPMSHGAGMYAFPHVLAGARHVVPESAGFEPAEVFALATTHRDVALFAAPTMVKRLVDHAEAAGADPSGLRTLVYGGGPMYAADIERAMAVMGPRFAQIYGQGESPMTITTLSRSHLQDRAHPRHRERIASVGVAFGCVEVRVGDAQGGALPPGAPGEVMVRGDTVMAGYWRNPEATAGALRGGWLSTGDVGALDEHGFLTLMDRSKDLVISGGSNIYPREVEEVLLRHPGVHEVSVVGAPDPEWGEVVVAFVVRRPDSPVSEAELDALCLSSIARFKRPRRYCFVDALPKNAYGKVLKTDLRERLAALPPAR